MNYLSHLILFFGGLNKNKFFHEIISKIDNQDDKKNLLSVLSLRFWGHFHFYSPVFSLILIDIAGNEKDPSYSFFISLLLISIGSASFALFDSIGGVFADNKGCKFSIRCGLWGMILLMLFYSFIAYFSNYFGTNITTAFAFIAQALIGIPLAFIDGADTVLTKKVVLKSKVLTLEEEHYLEGICTQRKNTGIAVASFFGCLIYVFAKYLAKDIPSLQIPITTIGASIFALTIFGQIIALIRLAKINEPDISDLEDINEQSILSKSELSEWQSVKFQLKSAFKAIYTNKVLSLWVLIIAVIEGWLMFSTFYFQLDGLKDLTISAENSLILVIVIPVVIWLLMQIAAFGGDYFNKWLKKKSHSNEKNNELKGKTKAETFVQLRNGGVLEIPQIRLIAACKIIGAMVVIYIVHLGISTFYQQSSEYFNILINFLPLVFFAAYQFLKGFSSPLLKTTLGSLGESSKLSNLTTTISLASSFGRLFHAITVFLFGFFLLFVFKNGDQETARPFDKSIAATIIIIILALLVLNVLSGIALDRQENNSVEETRTPLFQEIREIYYSYGFRLLVVKVSFVACLVMANILGPRMSEFGSLKFDGGAIPYSFTFLLVATVSEIEGRSSAKRLWFAGLSSYFVIFFIILLVGFFPLDKTYETIEIFDWIIKTKVLGCLFASLCSFSVAQYIDIWLFSLLKKIFDEPKTLWIRANITTFISQTIDTIIFVTLALWVWNKTTLFDWFSIVFSLLGIKWMFSLIATPLLYFIVRWVDRGKKLK